MSAWKAPSRSIFRLLIVILLCSIGFNVWFVVRNVNRKVEFNDHVDQRIEGRAALNATMKIEPNTFLFIGDSHVEMFPLNGLFPNKKILNLGISGSKLKQVIDGQARVDLGNTPEKIFIMAGVNDIFGGSQPEDVAKRMEQLLNILQERYPTVPLFVHAILPTREPYFADAIIASNALLKPICDEHGVTFIDMYASLEQNGLIRSELVYDKIHLNAEGYTLWAKVIEPYLN